MELAWAKVESMREEVAPQSTRATVWIGEPWATRVTGSTRRSEEAETDEGIVELLIENRVAGVGW
jgi:hypothetical protein